MAQGTAKDWQIISSHFLPYASAIVFFLTCACSTDGAADSGSSSSAG
jgi:hypothetical protein